MKKLYLVIVFFIGISLNHCTICDCPDIDGAYFDIMGFDIDFYGEDAINPIANGESIEYGDFSHIGVKFEVDYISCNYSTYNNSFGFSTMNSAYGCSCLWNGDEGSKDEKLQNIHIITLKDYNDMYKANDTINELFEVANGRFPDQNIDLNTYIRNDTSLILDEYVSLKPKELPSASKELQVKIIVELSNLEIYESTSEVLKFE